MKWSYKLKVYKVYKARPQIMDLSKFKQHGKFLMLALDHRGSFKKYIGKNPEAVTDAEIIKVKKMIIDSLADLFSGVLIDPEWGLPAYHHAKPYLLCVEKTGYEASGDERITELEYSVPELKKMGAGGIKILLYMNPEAKSTKKQLATAKKVLADCKKNRLPFFLEIVTYGNETLGKSRSEWVLRSLQKFLEAKIIPDVFKLEYSGDAESCKKITAMLGKTPWILLTRGESFEVFKEQLRVAVAAGAVGFLAGRALWQELANYPDDAGKKKFLETVVRARFEEINGIVLGTN